MKCPVCGGCLDEMWTCLGCGEVHDEPVQKIKKMMRSRKDENKECND